MDSRTAGIDRELKAKGYRITPRRLVVVDVLAERGGHVTADEIMSAVRQRYPSMNKSTVYRTLDLLREQGVVVMTDLGGGRLEYELLEHPHHHLICEECGVRIEIDDTYLAPLRQSLLEHYGFYTNLDHFALWGTCPQCKEAHARI